MGNVLLGLAALMLLAAVLAPGWRARAFEQRVEAVAAGVNGLRAEAEAILAATGSWPASAEGPALVPELPPGDSTVTLEWRRISSTVVPEPPSGVDAELPEADDGSGPEPPVPTPDYFERGAVSVHAGDDALLASLLERYPGSFVHDTVWTLLLPRVSAPPD
jgi:hypothetical protein